MLNISYKSVVKKQKTKKKHTWAQTLTRHRRLGPSLSSYGFHWPVGPRSVGLLLACVGLRWRYQHLPIAIEGMDIRNDSVMWQAITKPQFGASFTTF